LNSNHPRTLAIIQARMGSSRLPGKVLLDIGGEPMLVRVAERARRAATLSGVMVATTDDPSDDLVVKLCRERGYAVYRGSAQDVLDRYHQSAHGQNADVVVRLTGDCPVIDPLVIDRTVEAFFGKVKPLDEVLSHRGSLADPPPAEGPFDFAANRLPPPFHRTYPIGLDVEVCSASVLDYAWKHATEKHQREHVMPYLYDMDGRFNVLLVNHESDLGSLLKTWNCSAVFMPTLGTMTTSHGWMCWTYGRRSQGFLMSMPVSGLSLCAMWTTGANNFVWHS